MDLKINLPTEECTCEAKVFYDKYKKQVDSFIQHELAAAKTSEIVVGKKTSKKISKKPHKKHTHLPKIKGSKHREYGEYIDDIEDESVSISTTISTTDSYLPKIETIKKWSEDLLESSFSSISSLDTKKSKEGIQRKEVKRIAEHKTSQKAKTERHKKKEDKKIVQKQIIGKDSHEQIKAARTWKRKQPSESELSLKSGSSIEIEKYKRPLISGSSIEEEELTFDASTSTTWSLFKPKKTKKIIETKKLEPRQQKQLVTRVGKTYAKPLQKFKVEKSSASSSSSSSSSSPPSSSITSLVSSLQSEGAIPVPDQEKQEKVQIKKKSKKKKPQKLLIAEEVEVSSISSNETPPAVSIQLKKTASSYEEPPVVSIQLKKTASSYDEAPPEVSIQLKKTAKSINFLDFLKARSIKEGLHEKFIPFILEKAKEAYQEDELLGLLRDATEEGTLNALLYNLYEAIEHGELERVTSNLINEYKIKKRKTLISKLLHDFNSSKRDMNQLASLIAKAEEEDPIDDLIIILSRAVEENILDSLLSSLSKAKKQGHLDDKIDNLIHKLHKEQENDLLYAIESITEENKIDPNFIKDLLSKTRATGLKDQLLFKLKKAKMTGNLEEVISVLANATDDKPLNNLLTSRALTEKRRKIPESLSFLSDDIDDEFINEWHSKTAFKRDKTDQRPSERRSVLFPKKSEIKVPSDDESASDEIDVSVMKNRKTKQIRRKFKQIRKRKYSKESRTRKSATSEKDILRPTRSTILRNRQSLRRSRIERIKQRLLYKRQYSLGYGGLPDIDYSLIGRLKLSFVQSRLEDDKSEEEEEEEVVVQKIEEDSKIYRESFLKKIYGGRPIGPTPTPPSQTSVRSSRHVHRKPPPRVKSKLKTKVKESETEIEPVTPRKMKKHIVKYVRRKKSMHRYRYEKEISGDDTEISSLELLLDQKIAKVCEIGAEDRSERGYLVGFRYKDDDETVDWRKKGTSTVKEEESLISTESVCSGEWVSRARRRALIYFNTRKIEDFFHFLGSHLVSDRPENPIEYLIILLEDCIRFRNGIGRPPLLFEHYHVESLYCSMDIFNDGFITLAQYRTGMETLFVREFKDKPPTNQDNMVPKEIFIQEALKGQRIQLRAMIRGSSKTLCAQKITSYSTLGSIWSKVDVYQDG